MHTVSGPGYYSCISCLVRSQKHLTDSASAISCQLSSQAEAFQEQNLFLLYCPVSLNYICSKSNDADEDGLWVKGTSGRECEERRFTDAEQRDTMAPKAND